MIIPSAIWLAFFLQGPSGVSEEEGPQAGMDPVSRMFLMPFREAAGEPGEVGFEPEEVQFENQLGQTLTGLFYDVEGNLDETVMICMGNTGNMTFMLLHASMLVKEGLDVFLYNYQGFGTAGGVASIRSLMGDATSAFDYLIEEKGRPPEKIGVVGISLGSILALMIGAQKQPAAVMVEDVFLPTAEIDKYRSFFEDNILLAGMVRLLENTLVPSVDPMMNAPRFRGDLFLVHGVNDWLLSPRGTVEVSKRAASDRTRVWMMQGVGHSPESLIVNDREYASQMAGFFTQALSKSESSSLSNPIVHFSEESLGEGRRKVLGRIAFDRRAPVKLALVNTEEKGKCRTQFHRLWVEDGVTKFDIETPFKVDHVFAVAFTHVEAQESEGWVEDLSLVSNAYQAFLDFDEGLPASNAMVTYSLPGGRLRSEPASLEARHLEWVKRQLPDPLLVPDSIRPRYAQTLGRWAFHGLPLAGDIAFELLNLAEPFFPHDPPRHIHLGNAEIFFGFHAPYLRASIEWLVKATDDEMRRRQLKDMYLELWPEREEPWLPQKEKQTDSERDGES